MKKFLLLSALSALVIMLGSCGNKSQKVPFDNGDSAFSAKSDPTLFGPLPGPHPHFSRKAGLFRQSAVASLQAGFFLQSAVACLHAGVGGGAPMRSSMLPPSSPRFYGLRACATRKSTRKGLEKERGVRRGKGKDLSSKGIHLLLCEKTISLSGTFAACRGGAQGGGRGAPLAKKRPSPPPRRGFTSGSFCRRDRGNGFGGRI